MSLMLSVADKIADLFLEKIDSAASRKIRKFLAGDPEKKALAQCVKAGVLCMLQVWECQDRDDLETLEKVLLTFFEEPDVSRGLIELLTGKDWSDDDLNEIFTESSKGIGWPDDLDFDQGLHVFKAAFIASAIAEDKLQALIQTGNLFEQTPVLRAILAELGTLTDLMKKLGSHTPSQINAENVVSGVQLIMNQIEGPGIPENKLEAVYLDAFCEQCDALDLSITDDKYTHDENHCVHLSEIFTRLFLEGVTRFPEQSVSDAVKGKHAPMKQASEDADRKQESVPVTAIEAIAAVDRLAITGEPGGGKSTLVNYLFVRLAQARLQAVSLNDLEGWRGQKPLLPVRIILRKFAKWIPDATTQGQAGLVWDYIEAMIEEKKGRASVHDVLHYVRKTLETEGGIMFFDGLDEVGYGQEVHKRDVIKQAIMDISGQLKKAKIILTSRPYAYRSTDSWRLPKHTFAIVNLALFNKDQIHTFARRWYLKVGKTVKGWDDARCDQMTGYFYHAVDTRDRLFEIVRNPLLLTMAVALHSRDNFLPHKRAELYEKVIELLLAHWENNIVRDVEQLDVEQGSDAVPHLKLDMNKLLYSLSRIAFECHTHQLVAWTDDSETVDISRGDLLVALGQDFGQEMAGLIIEYIQFRTGILQGKDNQTYAFMHRTFQEYLAACYILEQERFNELILERMEHDLDWWQEVFLLMAGAAKTRRASTIRDLVEPLLGGKQTVHDFSDERDFKTLWLAAQTLWETNYRDECVSGHKETAALYQRTFKQVYDCLKQGMTATGQWKSEDRATAGKWLSRLGDDRRGVTDSGHMAFCPIAKGEFWLGDGKDDDCPQELCQALDYDYQLAKFPVTVAQYRQFAEAGGYQTAKYWPEAKEAGHWQEPGEVKFRRDDEWRKGMPELSSRFAYDNHPMVEVSWYECLAYCRWLTDLFRTREVGNQEIAGLIQQGWLLMLPSEIEWEKAARGSTPSKLLYPCGDEITSNCANYSETGLNSTSSVGCFPGDKSPCKCIDMTGNVIEWCRNTDESYPYLRDDREKVNKNPGSGRVIRGGCWGGSAGSCRCSFRFWDDPDYGRLILGFRVALVPSSVG